MTTQTFGNPSYGAFRAMTQLPAAIASAVADALSALSPRKAREELQRMADSVAARDPQLASRLRRAATANWYGEA